MNYLCSVSSSLVHNYNLGIQSGVWGVEDKYASRIAGVTPGDLLVFLVDRHFRSIHEITEGPYVDATPIWEPRESDYFRHRVRFGDAVASGSLPAEGTWQQISFMRDTQRWSGTVQAAREATGARLPGEALGHVHRAARG